MPNPLSKQEFEQAERDLAKAQDVILMLTPPQALALLGQLQLALRHPKNTRPSAQVAREIARQIQQAVATTPALRKLAEMGWNPANDVPPEKRP